MQIELRTLGMRVWSLTHHEHYVPVFVRMKMY
jgi:hypothetical protein